MHGKSKHLLACLSNHELLNSKAASELERSFRTSFLPRFESAGSFLAEDAACCELSLLPFSISDQLVFSLAWT